MTRVAICSSRDIGVESAKQWDSRADEHRHPRHCDVADKPCLKKLLDSGAAVVWSLASQTEQSPPIARPAHKTRFVHSGVRWLHAQAATKSEGDDAASDPAGVVSP